MGTDETERCCQPGDITVTQVPSGFLVGRVLPSIGLGPWWSFVAVVATLPEATRLAYAEAKESAIRVWLHRGGEDYDPLPELGAQ